MNARSEPAALRRARFVVAYDGREFHGFAEIAGTDTATVMRHLRLALERIVSQPVALVGAGRTDAGVHAWGQVVSVDLPATIDIEYLAHRLTRMCGPSVVVRSVDWADHPSFNARFDATYRQYRYTVLNAESPVPAMAASTWHIINPLDLWAMQLACDAIIGEHDFSSFCRKPKLAADKPMPSMRRRVMSADWHRIDSDYGTLLRFEIRANAFCHQMVRSIVGTMVDVGLGRLRAGEMLSVLHQRDRTAAGQVAPPQGLTLWEVGY